MSVVQLRKEVYGRFSSLWSKTDADRIDFGANNKFDAGQKGPWARIFINVSNSENAEVGTGFQRTEGFIVVQCFTEKNTGENFSDEMLDEVSSIFQNESFGSVSCFATDHRTVGQTANWFQKNALTRFQYDVFS